MIREVIELTLSTKQGEEKVLCENFRITSRGYIAIDYADGGYNCVYSASQLKGARLVMMDSIFIDRRDYLCWKNMFQKDAYSIYTSGGTVKVKDSEVLRTE